MAIEIVDLPIQKIAMFHSFLYVCQRVMGFLHLVMCYSLRTGKLGPFSIDIAFIDTPKTDHWTSPGTQGQAIAERKKKPGKSVKQRIGPLRYILNILVYYRIIPNLFSLGWRMLEILHIRDRD